MQIIERRAFIRHPVQTKGRVILPNELFYIECEISNRSWEGMQVELSLPLALPHRVVLWEEMTGMVCECDVRWRRERVVGLQIIDLCGRQARRTLVESGLVPFADDKVQLPCSGAAPSSVSNRVGSTLS